MNRVGLVIGVYATLAAASGLATFWLHGSALLAPGAWLDLSPLAAHAYGGLLGVTFGLIVARLTPVSVRRWSWARDLHAELSPLARGLSPGAVVMVAGLSALGEELLFRALLMPLVGLLPQAALFGLVHQLPGRSRWIWVLWASIMGLVLGVLYRTTGSILGPILAHAVINALNLRQMQEHEVITTPRPLGGVLGQGPLGQGVSGQGPLGQGVSRQGS
jgi:membrane protease YdiL (CAAX protease family)